MDERNWNNPKGLAKGSKEEIKFLNNYLEKIRAANESEYQELVLNKSLITAQNLKLLFFGEKKNERTIGNLMNYHNVNMKSVSEPGTLAFHADM